MIKLGFKWTSFAFCFGFGFGFFCTSKLSYFCTMISNPQVENQTFVEHLSCISHRIRFKVKGGHQERHSPFFYGAYIGAGRQILKILITTNCFTKIKTKYRRVGQRRKLVFPCQKNGINEGLKMRSYQVK